MADILAEKGPRKKYFTSQDWKTGIPEKDGWKILSGEVSIDTPKAVVAPTLRRPSIVQPKPIEPVKTANGPKADGEEGLNQTGVNENPEVGEKSSSMSAAEAVSKIETIESAEELNKFVFGDSRVKVINAFTKKTKLLSHGAV